MNLSLPKCQQGVALITVMLIVALAAVLASQMTARLQMQMVRTTNINFNQQAYWYAMGAEAFGRRVLITAFEEDPDITHLGQIWAQGETTYPVDFGKITGEITDLQSCLNLNALRASNNADSVNNDNPLNKKSTNNSKNGSDGNSKNNNDSKTNNGKNKLPARLALEELISALNIEGIGSFEAEYMADALTDWLDKDSAIASAGGAEDNDYSAKEFPYLPANNFLSSVNELRVVEHFTVPVINAIKPYVCVLPNTELHAININTINTEQPELLQALLGSSLDDANQILSAREEDGFKDLSEFLALPEMAKINLTEQQKKQFVVDSEYFTLKTTASFSNSYFVLNSIMHINKKQQIQVISRTVGKN
jgi:general secretion pathway protein K